MSGRSHFVHESEGVLSNMRFVKLDAAGNDFIAFDGRAIGGDFRPDPESVARWCDRRHGIGGDGVLILGEGADGADFSVVFLNPDGTEAFCGNGARAAFSWWRHMMGGDISEARFTAVDGLHEGHWIHGEPCVDLRIQAEPKETDHGAFVHTGTEHLVLGVDGVGLEEVDLHELAYPLRHHADFAPHGVNVNLVSTSAGSDGRHTIRTFEKGVEGETLSCGSGTVAAAAVLRWSTGGDAFKFRAPGGHLGVVLEGADRAWLSGPVEMPFSGTILLS